MSTSSPVYVLDTNIFVQAHRRHYAFDICPGFWDCLIHHHKTGRIVSIDRVRDEILAGDALEAWAKNSAPSSLVCDNGRGRCGSELFRHGSLGPREFAVQARG